MSTVIEEADESYFGGKRKGKRGRGAGHKIPVFGILERDGVVKLEVLKDVSAQSLLGLTIKTVRRGSIVYTDKFRSYDALMFKPLAEASFAETYGKKFYAAATDYF